jgi:hypothetical protein
VNPGSGDRAAPPGDPTLALSLARGELSEPIAAALGGRAPMSVVALDFPDSSGNSTSKLLIRDAAGRPRLVLLVSSPRGSEIVARGMERAAAAREALGPDLGDVVLAPVQSGRVQGLSYAILPYGEPLSNRRLLRRLDTLRFRKPVLHWLRAATARTAGPVRPEEVESVLAGPLRHVSTLQVLDERLRGEALRGLRHLESGAWKPRTVLMHGDLTRGNVLKSPAAAAARKFVLIDWPGSRLRGYPFFDLVAFGSVMNVRGADLKGEVSAHREILGYTPEEARYSLLAALGDLGLNLDCFPIEEYVRKAKADVDYLDSAFAG